MHYLKQPFRLCLTSLAKPSLFSTLPKMPFSEYFSEKDQSEIFRYEERKILSKKYRGLIDRWKKPLERKRLRQARIREIKANLVPAQPEKEKFIVHNPALGVEIPPNPENIFAVIQVDNRQFKVTNDCVIILDTKPSHSINQKVIFDQVLLAGTNTFTLIGRPYMGSVKVEGVLESISMSEKVLVFKKKRRKQYKKSYGSRVPLTTCRITSIRCEIEPQILEKAVPLL